MAQHSIPGSLSFKCITSLLNQILTPYLFSLSTCPTISIPNQSEVRRKLPLMVSDLNFIKNRFSFSQSHNNLLFAALITTGFHSLLHLGELTFPNNCYIQDWHKITKRSSLSTWPHQYKFLLPAHKADHFFEGNKVLICPFPSSSIDPCPIFYCYLSSCNRLFPAASPLWLTSKGHVLTHSFFMSCLHCLLPKSYTGTSMCARGTTYLASLGTPLRSFEAWEVYIHVHPTLLHLLLASH